MIAQMMQRLRGLVGMLPTAVPPGSECSAFGKHRPIAIRRGYPQVICRCGSLGVRSLKIGENTIRMSPAGVGDVIRWTGTQAAVATGDIGMAASGRPQVFVGGSNQQLAIVAETDSVLGWGASITGTPAYLVRWGSTTDVSVAAGARDAIISVPRSGGVDNLRIRRSNIAIVTQTFEVYINGGASGLTVVLTPGVLTGASSGGVAVAAGDTLEIQASALVGGNLATADLGFSA
jgi:hypothetical protein